MAIHRTPADAKDPYPSSWAATGSIAGGKIGCTGQTLRKWVCAGERDCGVRPGATAIERHRIKQLEREVRERRSEPRSRQSVKRSSESEP